MDAKPSVHYRGVIDASHAWLRPTPDIGVEGPAAYYNVYNASDDVRSVPYGRVWLGIADLDELAPVLFADWRFPTIARAVASAVMSTA